MQELDYEEIGARIRNVRKAKGLSQKALAEECGICLSFMGHIERGARHMSLETFANICEILDTNADELLWGVAHVSESVLDMWELSDRDKKKADIRTGSGSAGGKADSYGMYVRIMKSVAEIMNGG